MGRYYARREGLIRANWRRARGALPSALAGDALPSTKHRPGASRWPTSSTLWWEFSPSSSGPPAPRIPSGCGVPPWACCAFCWMRRLDLDLIELLEDWRRRHSRCNAPGVAERGVRLHRERLRGLMLERAGHHGGNARRGVRHPAALALGCRHPPAGAARILAAAGGRVLAAINKRIANILKKTQLAGRSPVDAGRAHRGGGTRSAPRPRRIARARAPKRRRERRYADALQCLVALRAPVDDFFERVMVMDEDLGRRNNRLALLRDVQRCSAASPICRGCRADGQCSCFAR